MNDPHALSRDLDRTLFNNDHRETGRIETQNTAAILNNSVDNPVFSFPSFLNPREDWKTGFHTGSRTDSVQLDHGGLGERDRFFDSMLELQRYLDTPGGTFF